jgi:HEAT repeat protein
MKRKDFSLPVIFTIISLIIFTAILIFVVLGMVFFFNLEEPPSKLLVLFVFSGFLLYLFFGLSAIILSFFKRNKSHYNKYFFLGHILLWGIISLLFEIDGKGITLHIHARKKAENLFTAVSPLTEAYSSKRVKELLESGANVNERRENGYSILMSAVKRCDPELVKILVEAGADVNAEKENGKTVLMYACHLEEDDYKGKYFSEEKQAEIVRILIEAGAKLNKGEFYDRPIIIAARNNNPLLVRELIKAGADFNIEKEDGRTALHVVSLKNPGIAEEFINAGLSLFASDKGGNIPLNRVKKLKKTYEQRKELFKFYEIIRVNAIRSLTDPRWFVRRNAAEKLGKEKYKEVVVPLIYLLNDEHWWVRSSSAEALGRKGDKKAVIPLTKAIKDDDWFVRYKTAVALGELGDIRAEKPLLSALNDEDPDVCEAAASALISLSYIPSAADRNIKHLFSLRIFDEMTELDIACKDYLINKQKYEKSEIKGDKSSAQALINFFKAQNEETKRSLINLMTEFEGEDISRFLQEVFDKEKKYQKQIVEILNETGEEEALEFFARALKAYSITPEDSIFKVFMEKENEVEDVLINVLKKTDYKFKLELAKTLGKMESKKAVAVLLKLVDDEYWRTRSCAVEALGKIGDKRAVEKILRSESKVEYGVLSKALGGIGGAKAMNYLIDDAKNKDSYTRSFSLAALWKIDNKKAREFVLEILEDNSADFDLIWRLLAEMGDKKALKKLDRKLDAAALNHSYGDYEWAIEALTKIGASSIPVLADELGRKDLYKRRRVVRALGEIGGDSAVNALIKVLKEESFGVEKETAEALIKIGKPAVEPLMKITKSNRDSLRVNALTVLSGIGDERALPSISKLLYDKRENVRKSAAAALASFGRASVPYFIKFLKSEKNNREMYSLMYSIVEILGDIGDERAIDMLTELMLGYEDRLIDLSFRSLYKILKKNNISRIDLFKKVFKHDNRNLRNLAMRYLSREDEPEGRPYFTSLVRSSKDSYLRGDALVRIGEPAVKWLGKLLEDRDKFARREAIIVLSKIKGPKAEKYLILSLEDEDEELRDLVRRILKGLDTPGAEKALRKGD